MQELPALPSKQLADASPAKLPTLLKVEPTEKLPAETKVCIVGAGAAGLFTAMIFDWLKSKGELPDLLIKYDLLEAAGEDRAGGRFYTYPFKGTKQYPVDPNHPHQYYDVGAMRFPDNPVMQKSVPLGMGFLTMEL